MTVNMILDPNSSYTMTLIMLGFIDHLPICGRYPYSDMASKSGGAK